MTKDLIQMLGLKEIIDLLAKANIVRLYGHHLGINKNSLIKKAPNFTVMEVIVVEKTKIICLQ